MSAEGTLPLENFVPVTAGVRRFCRLKLSPSTSSKLRLAPGVEETAEESQPAEESESAATEEAQTPVEETQAPVEEAQESNTGLVVGVIVVIAAVAVGGVLVAKKKKK